MRNDLKKRIFPVQAGAADWTGIIETGLISKSYRGCFVLRFLAEDAGKHLDHILDTILAALVHREKHRKHAKHRANV
jgi:hypothetical protein